MQELDDIALLRQYTEQNSEEAFAALVSRHVNKVYSVALRHTRNPHSAEEITQAVFVIFARKAKKLRRHAMLSGWLYQTARLTAVTHILRRTLFFRPLSAENKMDSRGLLSWLLLFVCCSLCALKPLGKGRTSRAGHYPSSLSRLMGFQYLPPKAV